MYQNCWPSQPCLSCLPCPQSPRLPERIQLLKLFILIKMNGPFQLVYLFWIRQCSALFKISTWLEGGVGHRQSFYIFILIPWSTLPLFVSRVSNFFNGLTVHSSDGSVHISQTILWKKCYRFHICISNEGTNCHQVVKKKSYLRVKPETMMGNQDTGRKEATHRFFRFLLGATATLVKRFICVMLIVHKMT